AELSAVEIASGVTVTFDADACRFGYRDSIFKQQLKDGYVITSITLKLRKTPQLVLTYPALRDELADISQAALTPLAVSQAVCAIRRRKLPDPAQLPNAGSFFKNPVITRAHFERLQNVWPDIVAYPIDDTQVKLAAAWLIDTAGWRGHNDGAVAVHAHQALVLVNVGRGEGEAILRL